MKTSKFTAELSARGCLLSRNGSNHDIWLNPANGKEAPVPRHKSKEIDPRFAKEILKQLGLI